MGLFDKRDTKKKKGNDDFDSPVEQIDLSAPAPRPSAPPAAPATAAANGAAEAEIKPPAAAQPEAQPAPARRQRQPEPMPPDYGIDRAIELMRTLPSDNVELVVQVVKHTLESTQIKIPEIIQDAIRKQESIQGRIGTLGSEIDDFEREIKTRREEIERLEADFEETSTVRERLELAEKLGKKDDGAPSSAAKAGQAPERSSATSAAPSAGAAAGPATARPAGARPDGAGADSKPSSTAAKK